MNPTHRNFSPQQKATIVSQYVEQKKTITEVAYYWKASSNTIHRVLREANVEMRGAWRRPVAVPYTERRKKQPRFTEEQLDEMVNLYVVANKTKDELATIYGVSANSIETWLRKRNVQFRKPGRRKVEKIKLPPKPRPIRLTQQLKSQIAGDKLAGLTWKELGEHYFFCYKYLCAEVGPVVKEMKALLP